MAFGNNRNEKIVHNIVNLTNKSISVYEDSTGNIVTFNPTGAHLPPEPRPESGKGSTIYVVTREEFEFLVDSSSNLDDVAFVNERGAGWHGHEVCRLLWAANPDIYVRLRKL